MRKDAIKKGRKGLAELREHPQRVAILCYPLETTIMSNKRFFIV